MKIALGEQADRRERDRTQRGFDGGSAHAPEPAARQRAGRKLRFSDTSRVKSGKTGERRLGRLGATPKRSANALDRLAKIDRSRQEIGGKIRALGNAFLQPVRLLGRQHLRVPQPLHDIRGVAQVVLMGGEAATGFGVGEVEREIVGDQRQRPSAGGGEFGRYNRHLHLYRL